MTWAVLIDPGAEKLGPGVDAEQAINSMAVERSNERAIKRFMRE